MVKANVVVDNADGSILAVFFNTEQAMEYLNFMTEKHGQMVSDDPETYRFVWEELEDYSREWIQSHIK